MAEQASFPVGNTRGVRGALGVLSRLASPIRVLAALALIVVFGVLALAALISLSARERALVAASQSLRNTATLIARHFDQQLGDIADDQRDLVERLEADRFASEDDFQREMQSPRTHEVLRGKVNKTDVETEFAVFDDAGVMLASSSPLPGTIINIASRGYFGELKSGANGPLLHLARSAISRRWILVSAAALRRRDGRLLGVVTRRIQLDTFTDFLSSPSLPQGSAIAIHLKSGELVTRYPAADSAIGRNFDSGSAEQHALFAQSGYSTRQISPIDGEDRLVSSETLAHFPLVVVAAETVTTALRDWSAQTQTLGKGAAIAIGVLTITFLLIIRLLTRDHRAAAARLTQERNRFELAVDNMTQGLLLFDSEHNLTLCNDRYLGMYGLTRDMVRPGCSLRELITLRKQMGSIDIDVDAYCSKILLDTITGRVATKTAPDGRTVQIVHTGLPDGGWVVTHTDITEQQNQHRFIEQLAHFDQLTNLPNRTLFGKKASGLLADLAAGEKLAVIYVDLDEFKAVNDTLGHRIGDALLKHVARQLAQCVSGTDIVARLGGDEFALVKSFGSREELVATLARIHSLLRESFDCEGHAVSSDASIGVAIAPVDGRDLETLLANADLALYAAKGSGRHTHRFYEAGMSVAAAARHAAESELRIARSIGFRQAGFAVHFQPVADLLHGRIVGCEALLRWFHPTKGMISPADFIPVAEESGIICALGIWVLEAACRAALLWPDRMRVAVNLSPVQVREENFLTDLDRILAETGFPAGRLELEITEAVLMRDSEHATQILSQIRARGIRLVLDDFGTGYSSLSYLHRFDFDKIKIDRSFVHNMVDSEASLSIVQSIIGLAASRNLRTTAEGIETATQRDMLRAIGCHEMQGFLLSRAVPATELPALFAAGEVAEDADAA